MRLIIAGGREFKDYDLLCDEASYFIVENVGFNEEVVILSGLARGADKLGVEFAKECEYTLECYPADWHKWGYFDRGAGLKRNKVMATKADSLIAFWDGKSRGTMHMIDTAHEKGLEVKVVMYDSA
jgi:hypothetical protein